MSYLNLASIRLCTESEGPGKRMAIWVQGCERRCPGCCNVEMQEIQKNIIVDTSDIIKLIEKTAREEGIEGVSFIGGEPILQSEGLSDIAKWCQDENLSVLVFTGYLYQNLINMNNKYVNRLIKNTDLLVDGPFIEEKYDEKRYFVGSTNQKVWFLSKKYKPGIEFEKKDRSMEVLISEKNILINGWPFI